MVTYGRNLLWQRDILRNCDLALLDRTLQVHIRDLLTQIGLCVDQTNQAILDLDVHVCAFLHICEKCSYSFDGEVSSTVYTLPLASAVHLDKMDRV